MGSSLKNKGPRKKCKSCQYRADDRKRGCNYMLLTGKRRGCSAAECNVFVKGQRISKGKDPAWGLNNGYEY